MSGENGRATPPAEGAPPAADTTVDATAKNATVDAQKEEAPAAETKAEPAPASAPAESDEPTEGSTAAAHGIQNTTCLVAHPNFSMLTLLPLPF